MRRNPRLGPKHWLLSGHTGLAQESVGVALAAATAFLRGVKNDIHGKEDRQKGLGGYQSLHSVGGNSGGRWDPEEGPVQ